MGRKKKNQRSQSGEKSRKEGKSRLHLPSRRRKRIRKPISALTYNADARGKFLDEEYDS
jgi:hypothetical protein